MRIIAVLGIAILFFGVSAGEVYACGGGAPFFIQDLEGMDIIVHATVLDVDDRGYSAIIQVDNYFKGSGANYLAVVRHPVALEVVSGIRGYDTSCLYSGGGQEWVNGSSGYFALSSNGDGTYTDSIGLYRGMPHFISSDGQIEYYSSDFTTNVGWQLNTVSVAEFEALLLEIGSRSEMHPPTFVAYPLMRFLYLTTESGLRYRLNPDRSLTELDPEVDPLAISNDGSHVVFQLDEGNLGFQYLSLTKKPLFEDIRFDGGWLIPQDGYSALFSPDSNFVAVQEETQLVIYMFDNYERGGYGQRMRMQAVGTAEILRTSRDNVLPVMWSEDSTTIAYQDQRGIWLWDIFEDAEPYLALSGNGEHTLIGISQTGRYIRYDNAETWGLLDIQSGEIHINAIAAPDERNLIYIQSEFPAGTPDINRWDNRLCQIPLALTCPIYISFAMNADGVWPDIFWYKNDQIALLGCREENCYVASYPWRLSIGNTNNHRSQLNTPLPLMTAFAYDLTYDQPVVAVEGYVLEFGFYPSYERDEPSDLPVDIDLVDLRDVLDSPIVKLEWGQPIFYYHSQP